MSIDTTVANLQIRLANTQLSPEHTDVTPDGEYEAELWCEFDCVAYVFVGNDPDELTARLNEARSGEITWDYVRPLSRAELYNMDA